MKYTLDYSQICFISKISMILGSSPATAHETLLVWYGSNDIELTYLLDEQVLTFKGDLTELQFLAITGAAQMAKISVVDDVGVLG